MEAYTRFVGTWLASRAFRKKECPPIFTVSSQPRSPTSGVPQGGALSPLLWLLHVNILAGHTALELKKRNEGLIMEKVHRDSNVAFKSNFSRRFFQEIFLHLIN